MKTLVSLLFALCFADCWRPALAADIKNARSGQEGAKSGSPRTIPFPSSPSTSRCRRVRPMIPPARRGWPSFTAALIDEGAGNMDSKRLPRSAGRSCHSAARQCRARLSGDLDRHLERERAARRCICCRLALTHPRFDAEAVNAGAGPDHPGFRKAIPGQPHAWRGAAFCASFLRRPSLWPSQRWRGRQHFRHHGRGSARLRPKPLGQGRPEDRGGGRHHRAGGAEAAGRHLPAGVRAPRRRRCPMSGGWAAPGVHVHSAAGAAADRRVRPARHHARRSGFHSRLCRQLHPGRRRISPRA